MVADFERLTAGSGMLAADFGRRFADFEKLFAAAVVGPFGRPGGVKKLGKRLLLSTKKKHMFSLSDTKNVNISIVRSLKLMKLMTGKVIFCAPKKL